MGDRRRVQDFAAVTSRSTEQGRCLDVSLQLVQPAEEDRGPLVCLVLKAQRQILQVNIWNLYVLSLQIAICADSCFLMPILQPFKTS